MADNISILCISSVCSEKTFNKLENTLKTYAIQKYMSLLINGLNMVNGNINVLSLLSISRKRSKKIFWKKEKFNENGINYIQLPFINFKFLKHLIFLISVAIEILIWNKKNKKKEKIIICDAMLVNVNNIVLMLAKLKRIKTIGVVTDISDRMSNKLKEKSENNFFNKMLSHIYEYNWNNYSGYILLTEKMNNIVNPNARPYVIIEGIVNNNIPQYIENRNSKYKYIMYAGSLVEKYGVKNLVDGFIQLKNNEIQLHIYGDGDEKIQKYIEHLSEKYSNLKYYGIVSNKIIIEREREAILLVNPRPTYREFTLYSFPSKNMEYMLSGRPLLTTKLPGMPKEYYDYIYLLEDENADGIKKCLEKIINTKSGELDIKGKKAQEFVLKEKNNIVQAKKVINLIKEIK